MGKVKKKKEIFKSLNKKLIIVSALLFIAFLGSQISIASLVGTKSGEIEQIRIEADRLRLENEILQSEVDRARSIENVKEVAQKYGLQEKQIKELEDRLTEQLAVNY